MIVCVFLLMCYLLLHWVFEIYVCVRTRSMMRQTRLRSELLDLQKVYELDKLSKVQRKTLLAKLAALRDVDNRRLSLRAASPPAVGGREAGARALQCESGGGRFLQVEDVKWVLATETVVLKLQKLNGRKGQDQKKDETHHVHVTPFAAQRGGRYEVQVQPVGLSADAKAPISCITRLKLLVLPPKANSINQAVARAEVVNRGPNQHLAFTASTTGTFRVHVEGTAASGGDSGMIRVSVIGVGVEKGFTITKCRWSTPTTRQQEHQGQLRWYDVHRIRAANLIKRKYRRHYYKRTQGATTLEAIVRGWKARKNANEDNADRDRLEREWSMMDRDGSGELSLDEVTDLWKKLGKNVSKEKALKEFKKLDKDGSGELSLDEFLPWYKKQRAKAKARIEEIKHIEALWKQADVDRSGTLDEGELRKVLEWLGIRMNKQQFDKMMYKLDKDGGGDISQGEFLDWWTKLDEETRADAMGTNLAAMFADGPLVFEPGLFYKVVAQHVTIHTKAKHSAPPVGRMRRHTVTGVIRITSDQSWIRIDRGWVSRYAPNKKAADEFAAVSAQKKALQ
eukprot:COSAG02_NODE_9147_length_2312_cov_3.600581_1_plen_565_part_10